MSELDDIKKRLHNAELMINALVYTIKQMVPEGHNVSLVHRQVEYFKITQELGGMQFPEFKGKEH
jgi:hypothetical protein